MSSELYYYKTYKVRSNQFRKYGSRKKIRNEDQCLSEVFKIKVIDLRLKQMMEWIYDLLATINFQQRNKLDSNQCNVKLKTMCKLSRQPSYFCQLINLQLRTCRLIGESSSKSSNRKSCALLFSYFQFACIAIQYFLSYC